MGVEDLFECICSENVMGGPSEFAVRSVESCSTRGGSLVNSC
jgi:hypothetical protein